MLQSTVAVTRLAASGAELECFCLCTWMLCTWLLSLEHFTLPFWHVWWQPACKNRYARHLLRDLHCSASKQMLEFQMGTFCRTLRRRTCRRMTRVGLPATWRQSSSMAHGWMRSEVTETDLLHPVILGSVL